MKTLKHKLPVYYIPYYNGMFVVREVRKEILIIGDCCTFYNDAYTNIVRYEIKKDVLSRSIRLNKRKLNSYCFLSTKNLVNHLAIDKKFKDETYLFYKDESIIKTYYVK